MREVKGRASIKEAFNISKVSMKNSQNALQQSTEFSIMGAFSHIEETKPRMKSKKLTAFLNR